MTMTKVEIKNKKGKVIAMGNENETLLQCLERLVREGADLSGAVLRGADLSGADLSEANLSEADLSGADLRGADLSGAVIHKNKVQEILSTIGIIIK